MVGRLIHNPLFTIPKLPFPKKELLLPHGIEETGKNIKTLAKGFGRDFSDENATSGNGYNDYSY